MRTREEILNQAIDEHPFQGLDKEEEGIALAAMDEYAKEFCMAMLNYINKVDAEYAPMWDGETWAGNEEDITAEQYLEKFIQSIKP